MKKIQFLKILVIATVLQTTRLLALPLTGPNSWETIEKEFVERETPYDAYHVYYKIISNMRIDLANNENVDYLNSRWPLDTLRGGIYVEMWTEDKDAPYNTGDLTLRELEDYVLNLICNRNGKVLTYTFLKEKYENLKKRIEKNPNDLNAIKQILANAQKDLSGEVKGIADYISKNFDLEKLKEHEKKLELDFKKRLKGIFFDKSIQIKDLYAKNRTEIMISVNILVGLSILWATVNRKEITKFFCEYFLKITNTAEIEKRVDKWMAKAYLFYFSQFLATYIHEYGHYYAARAAGDEDACIRPSFDSSNLGPFDLLTIYNAETGNAKDSLGMVIMGPIYGIIAQITQLYLLDRFKNRLSESNYKSLKSFIIAHIIRHIIYGLTPCDPGISNTDGARIYKKLHIKYGNKTNIFNSLHEFGDIKYAKFIEKIIKLYLILKIPYFLFKRMDIKAVEQLEKMTANFKFLNPIQNYVKLKSLYFCLNQLTKLSKKYKFPVNLREWYSMFLTELFVF